MKLVRRSSSASDGTSSLTTCGGGPCGSSTTTRMHSTSKLFQPGVKILVQRAPLLSGLNVVQSKKFQRPMLKRRAYDKAADVALKQSSLGQKRRFDGMAKLLARAGKGLNYKLPNTGFSSNKDGTESESGSDDDEEEEGTKGPDTPYEPLCLWTSPHQEGGESKGLPAQMTKVLRADEYGVEEEVTVLQPAPATAYAKHNVIVPEVLGKWLRPHQREGVQFMYECVMSLRDFRGNGCILADDMGLGKTLQSVALIYTMLKTGITADGSPSAKRIIVICPCSLVKNWANEFVKWLGQGVVKTLPIAEADRKTVEKNLDTFVRTKMFNVLIASYECIRTHAKRLIKFPDCCDLMVCDEAHRLKNSDNQTSKALNSIPCKRRILLTGTPMQNDLQEFYAMVDFTNPGILGTPEDFRRKVLFPILRGREPDATDSQKKKMVQIQQEMSATVNDFIIRRVNTLNAKHLPPKLVQVVCCNLTDIQKDMYTHLIESKDTQHVLEGKQVNCLGSIQMLMKLCNHPSLIVSDDKPSGNSNQRASSKNIQYNFDEKETAAAPGAGELAKYLPYATGGGKGDFSPVHPEWSGKMLTLFLLMKEMRKPGNGSDKIVIISNYTQTLDLIGRMCRENHWGCCRLDGSTTMKKRQQMVDEFNDPASTLVAFLLSSKAGGCGLNLIGANRLVLFDPDWNPAVDKQAAARCWRDGQKKRCFTYRFLATGTVEEKIFQRQLSKEGLQSVVDDKDQVNALSTKDLRNLFKLRTSTPSDTHDKLRCERCAIINDDEELEAKKVLPNKLAACKELLDEIEGQEDSSYFLKATVADEHGKTKDEYDKLVKQPMDLGSIRTRLEQPSDNAGAYKSVSGFSKDVNRIFSNVMKVWSPGDEIADASRRLQTFWYEKWTELVPRLMKMKSDNDEKVDGAAAEDPLDVCANLHNERGEDYQEQIGMPDEEDMRQWSHHHSVDTVDDPVFRAALRGRDAVSFVFGLEVTWSLIQERQQEEEEKLALEALDSIQGSLDEDVDQHHDQDVSVSVAVADQIDEFSDDADGIITDNVTEEARIASDSKECLEQAYDHAMTNITAGVMIDSADCKPSTEIADDKTVSEYISSNLESPSPDVFVGSTSGSSRRCDDAGQVPELPKRLSLLPALSSPTSSSTKSEDQEMLEDNHPTPDSATSCDSNLDDLFEILPPKKKSKVTEPEDIGKENAALNVEIVQPSKSAGWCCVTCTFQNSSSKRKCEMCGEKKPATARSRR